MPSLVQSASGSAASATSVTVTLSSGTTAGNCLAVCVGTVEATTNPVVSGITLGGSAGNFAAAKSQISSTDCNAEIWTDANCAGGQTSVVVSLTGGAGGSPGVTVEVMEWSGVAAVSPVDRTAGQSATSSSWSSTSTAALSQASEVVIGACSASLSITINGPSSPWTNLSVSSPGGTSVLLSGYQVVSSTAAQAYSGTFNTNGFYSAVVVTLKAANPSAGPAFRQASAPARIRPSLPPRGRAYSNPGGPVSNPVPGPPLTPAPYQAAAMRQQRAPRSRPAMHGAAGVRAAPPPPAPQVVNQWANSYGQGTTFTSITSAFQSCVVPLNGAYSVGGGTGVATAGNWLFVVASWTQLPALAEVHIGTGDDVRSWYREYPASNIAGNTRTAISYTPNLARAPQDVYVAPDGQVAAINVLVVEVSGLGPWDTVASGSPVAGYASSATSLSLSLGAPAAASFFIAAFGGDNAASGQSLLPAGWTGLSSRAQTNGSNHLADNILTSACLPSSGGSQSVSASASSAENLSGFMLAVYTTGTSPIPANSNPNWPHVVFEAGFGSGFNTPDSEVTWTDLSSRIWNWDETTGIQFQLGQLQSTDMSVELDNWDGNLSPLSASSPYAGLMVPGTPIRLRMAFGTIGGITENRWFIIQRNAAEWNERITDDYRRYIHLTGTDIWASLSETPPTFYRSEVYTDDPYAWWPLDDQPGAAGVLPVNMLNAATGNTNTLNAAVNPSKGVVEPYYDTNGASTIAVGQQGTPGGWTNVSGFPPGIAIYTTGAAVGWMFGDPQSATAAVESSTGNPVEPNPGSAAWQTSGLAGNTGSNGWFLYSNDGNFPALSGGVTVEVWFNVKYYAGGTAYVTSTYGGGSSYPITQQPYNQPVTIWEMATGSHPVCILQLSSGQPGSGGNLNLITYNGATATSHSIYTGSDLRDNSWHMVTVELTATTWQVWLDGGANANVSGTATGMTSAWTWLIANGDLGANGGSSTGTGLVHGANMALSHIAVYPARLPYYRVLDHYWAAVTAFGQLAAPQSVQISWAEDNPAPIITTVGGVAHTIQSNAQTGDGSTGPGSYDASNGIGMSAVVTATAPGGITSGPSAWSASATALLLEYLNPPGTTYAFASNVAPFIVWTGVAPTFNVYTSSSVGSELEASVVSGNSEAFTSGFGGSGNGTGVSNVSGGSGASPPASPSAIGDTVGQRIERLMRAGKASSPNRCIDPASLLVQAPGSAGGGVQAGAAIQAIQQSDSGFLAVDNNNHLFYWSRPHLASQYNSPVWALGPTTSQGHIPYHLEIRWPTDPQRVWNAITVTPFSPTGASLPAYTPTNASAVQASQAQYGAQPYSVTSWLQSTSEQQAQANWIFSTFGTPQRRAEDVKVDAAPYPAAWPLVAAIGVGDVITIEDWAIGGGGTNYTFRVTELHRRLVFGARGDQVEAYVMITADFEPTSYWA